MPQAVLTLGIQTEQATAGFLLIYALSYTDGDKDANVTALADYAARNINNEIRRVNGVGKLQFFASEAAMRVWIDPQKLVGYGLSIDDVNNAIRAQNVQVPAGAFGSTPGSSEQELTATPAVKGTPTTRRNSPPSCCVPTRRLAPDPGRRGAHRGRQPTTTSARARRQARRCRRRAAVARCQRDPDRRGGQAASDRAVGQLPGQRRVLRAVRHLALRRRGDRQGHHDPHRGHGAGVPGDVPVPAERALHPDPVHRRAGVSARYADLHVPAWLLGEHDDHVRHGAGHRHPVDDAIVVVENVERIMAEEGSAPVPATIKAMGQVSGAIIGITPVLSAVFLPLAFMAGSVG